MSIQSRITRGIGYGVISVSMLGFYTPEEIQPPIYIGGSFAYRPEVKPKRKNIEEDEILMLFM